MIFTCWIKPSLQPEEQDLLSAAASLRPLTLLSGWSGHVSEDQLFHLERRRQAIPDTPVRQRKQTNDY